MTKLTLARGERPMLHDLDHYPFYGCEQEVAL